MSSAAFLALSAQLLLGMVFFVSAATKILRPTAFVQAVRDYRLLPPSAVRPLAYALIASEAFLAVALAAQLAPEIAIPFALVLLLVFAAAGLVTLRRQLEINCGCFGGAEEPVGRLSLARIGMLVTVALVAWAELPAWNEAGRPTFVALLTTEFALAFDSAALAILLLILGVWALHAGRLRLLLGNMAQG